MSDDFQTPADPAAHAVTAPTADVGELREQLKAVTAERDRHLFEKSEIVEKANVISRERDELRQRLATATTERDRLASEASSAARAAKEAADEIARLRRAVESAPSADPAEALWSLITQKTKQGVAFLRGKIPENSPALPWFDKTIEIVTRVGCLAVKAGVAFGQWARAEGLPRAKELAAKLATEVEARLAKK